MTAGPSRFVLDSFALLALFQAEHGAEQVRDLLQRARREEATLAMAVVNLGEVVYRTIRTRGERRAQDVLVGIEDFSIEFVDIDRELALSAARLKGVFRISYADCIAAALAMRLDATLVTGDPDFRLLEDRVAVEWLTDHEAPAQ